MERPAHRAWMYNRRTVGRKGFTPEFLQGLKEFLSFTCQQPQYLNEGLISCPCKLCKNERRLTPKGVNAHLRQKGFTPGYWFWTSHGEEVPQMNVDVDMDSNAFPYSSQEDIGFDDADLNDQNFVQNEEVPPNAEATEMYDVLNSTHQPLPPGLMWESNHNGNVIPSNSRDTERTMQPAKMSRKKKRAETDAPLTTPSKSGNTKEILQPTKRLRKKKSAETRDPLAIPSDNLQTFSNQATQPPSRTKPRTKLKRLPPTKPLNLHTQPQPTQSHPQLRLRPQPTQPQLRPRPQPTPPPQPQLRMQPQPTPPTQPQLHTQPRPTPPRPQPQSPTTRSESHPVTSQTIPTQVLQWQEFSVDNLNQNKIPILPEGDGFDQHNLVVKAIGSIIRTYLAEGIPSWKQISKKQRDSWFDIFKSMFTWPPEHKDLVRRNFEKRGSAKMVQLMQDARRKLDHKPSWMEECVWTQLKAHWESSKYKRISEINKRNSECMADASLHTGGSIPHRLHWKRMKEANGTDPSMAEFYFRTHRKKDQSWVGPSAESAYKKFEQRKLELSSKFDSGENSGDNQQSIEMPSDLDIWVDSIGHKKGRVFGLGSVNKTLVPSVRPPGNSGDVNALRSQVHALNESLHKQEQEKLEMKQELTETRKQLAALMEHLGFAGSSSRPFSSPQNSNGIDNGDDYTDEGDDME
ncbi:unnamed protein product [Vicia faba]|uniref:Transposase-associated domain-containing protein n=1 Tax=Vicia faba TaxID=3906 RepID=A0AAV1ACI8_VICFA|nr:unnamed protein product [Vicia faba]